MTFSFPNIGRTVWYQNSAMISLLKGVLRDILEMYALVTFSPEQRILSESVGSYDPLWQEVEPEKNEGIFTTKYA